MPTLKAYTFIEENVLLDGAGAAIVPHDLIISSGGIAAAGQEVTVMPLEATSVGIYVSGVDSTHIHLAGGGAAGHVRVQVQAIHSVQQ